MVCIPTGLDTTVPTGVELAGVATVSQGTVPDTAVGGMSGLDSGVCLLGGADPGLAGMSSRSAHGAGVFMGEGLPPVPGRLVERIRRWEFIEMFELLPELLADQRGGEGGAKQTSRAKGRKRVQEIGVWLQCFAVFVGVVVKFVPEVVPGLMAYMVSIIRASQEYEGAAWVAYDAAFRRQAAATGQRDWSGINTSLYTICFTGKARKSQRCDNCLSAAHRTVDCYALGEEDVDVNGRVKAMETALLTLSQGAPSRGARPPDVCRLFNEKRCNFRSCKYRHACRWCGGAHPGCECRQASRPEQGPGPIRHEHPRSGGAPPPY